MAELDPKLKEAAGILADGLVEVVRAARDDADLHDPANMRPELIRQIEGMLVTLQEHTEREIGKTLEMGGNAALGALAQVFEKMDVVSGARAAAILRAGIGAKPWQ